MEKSTLIKVLNRDNGAVGYAIPEMNGLKRIYQAGETKEITFEEIEKLFTDFTNEMEIYYNILIPIFLNILKKK